jgi:prephenate dehydrogenase
MALAMKKKKLCQEVVAVTRHAQSLRIGKKMRAIDRGSLNLEIIRDADLVILAMPVSAILRLAPRVRKIISKGCLVTDVGSTKEEIVAKLSKLFPNYIGSHPLAGSEKRSIAYARPDLFKNSFCILTPASRTDRQALRRINKLWKDLGAKTVILSPARHDKILSLASHLPHILAFSLISAVPRPYLKFAAGGLKDTTRIAASDSELWSDIFLSNRGSIIKAIGLLEKRLNRIKSAIKRKDKRLLDRILKLAKKKRDKLH